jgi:hypothetical protein
MPTLERPDPNPHLLVHLQEVCAILAAALVRLRRHTAEDIVRDLAEGREAGESSLPFVRHQRGHARSEKRKHV